MADMTQLETMLLNPGLLENRVNQAAEIVIAVVTSYGLKMIGAVIILIVGWTVSGMVHSAIMRAAKRSPKVDVTIFTFVASLAKYAVLIFTLVATLSSFGVETTSFVAVLGAMGLAIGLAFQGALGHVASGIMLVLFRPFRVGDSIETAGVAGVVTEISLFTTEIRTGDNIKIVIPNSAIWSGVIKNLSGHVTRRFSFEVGISYTADIEQAIDVIDGIIADDLRILREPPPLIGVSKLGEAAVILVVEAWVQSEHLGNARYDLNKRIKEAFDRKGIAGAMASQRIYVATPRPGTSTAPGDGAVPKL